MLGNGKGIIFTSCLYRAFICTELFCISVSNTGYIMGNSKVFYRPDVLWEICSGFYFLMFRFDIFNCKFHLSVYFQSVDCIRFVLRYSFSQASHIFSVYFKNKD